jgi:plasmid stabilization system protein ParE
VAQPRRAIIWTDRARAHLDTVLEYIANDSLIAAGRLLEETLQIASTLETLSERGRMVPELQVSHVREIIVGQYRLMYEVTPQEVRILAFIHGARDVTRLTGEIWTNDFL